jgi:GT2 family glycosyltransferase
MSSRVALIILNYNGLKNLGDILMQSIESALRIDYKDLDVIVVDNGSTDNSVEEIEDRFGSDVTLIKLEKNYGYAGGNEIGLRRYLNYKEVPEYVVIVIMNNDFIVKNEHFLRSIVKYLDARKDIAVAQGITLQVDGKRIESAGVFLDVMLQKIGRCGGLKPGEYPEKLSYATFAIGALMVVKIKPVLEIRGCLFKRALHIMGRNRASPYHVEPRVQNNSCPRDLGHTHEHCNSEESYAPCMVCWKEE